MFKGVKNSYYLKYKKNKLLIIVYFLFNCLLSNKVKFKNSLE